MKALWIGLASLFISAAALADQRLAKGEIVGVNGKAHELTLKGSERYRFEPGVVVETSLQVHQRIPLVPGLRVTLYSENGESVSRIVIHGPYSVLRKIQQH